MYLNVGGGEVVADESIIGIFDLDITSQSHITREFLSRSEKSGNVVNVSDDIPKTYIICAEGDREKLYLCQPSPATLVKRSQSGTI